MDCEMVNAYGVKATRSAVSIQNQKTGNYQLLTTNLCPQNHANKEFLINNSNDQCTKQGI